MKDIELILLRGAPGCGKNTLAEILCSAVVHADEYFIGEDGVYRFDASKLKEAHAWCLQSTELLIQAGVKKIGVANTFTRAWEMEPYFKLAEQYGIRIHTLVVENRHGGKNVHGVPEDVVAKMRDRFEVVL